MTLQQLKYIIEIARHGSINEAAKKLFISQPSLSTAVKELESELDIEIFLRSAKGVTLSSAGAEFLRYARQVVEQSELLVQRYNNQKPTRQQYSISTQHYAFAVNAFVNLIENNQTEEYEFTLRETRTHDIITDVANLRSEIGIIYLNEFNRKILNRILKEHHVTFHPLFQADPHVFISKRHPLAKQPLVSLAELAEYPYLSFEQGEYNSFYFSEEILSTVFHKKNIHVSDRATLFNLLIGLNGYTISTGVLDSDLNGNDIVAIPLDTAEKIIIGWISANKTYLSKTGQDYIAELKQIIAKDGFQILE